VLEAEETTACPALHGAERGIEVGRDLRLREPAVVRHLQHAPMILRKLGQRVLADVKTIRRLYGDDFLVDESRWSGTAPGT